MSDEIVFDQVSAIQMFKAIGIPERAACTVVATSFALRIPIDQARDLLAKHGRKPRCGCKWSKIAPKLGFETRPDLSCRTLASIMPEMIKGRFIVRHGRHVFAVIDGKVKDWRQPKPGLRVKMVYQVP